MPNNVAGDVGKFWLTAPLSVKFPTSALARRGRRAREMAPCVLIKRIAVPLAGAVKPLSVTMIVSGPPVPPAVNVKLPESAMNALGRGGAAIARPAEAGERIARAGQDMCSGW